MPEMNTRFPKVTTPLKSGVFLRRLAVGPVHLLHGLLRRGLRGGGNGRGRGSRDSE